MGRACHLVWWVLLAFYLLALGVFAIGTFGLFGEARDPLSGVFLIPLGLPWNLLVDVFPEPLWPWLAAAAPVLNLVLLRLICRRLWDAH